LHLRCIVKLEELLSLKDKIHSNTFNSTNYMEECNTNFQALKSGRILCVPRFHQLQKFTWHL